MAQSVFIFLTCLFCGVLSGTVYDVLYVARCVVCGIDKKGYTVKDKIFIIISDILYCLVFAAGFIFVSVMFDFTSLRLYMLFGCVVGALIYLKSFHTIVAFCVKKVYNAVSIKIQKRKSKSSERTEEKPRRRRFNGKRNNISSHSRRRADLHNVGNRDKDKRKKRIAGGDSKIRTVDKRRRKNA